MLKSCIQTFVRSIQTCEYSCEMLHGRFTNRPYAVFFLLPGFFSLAASCNRLAVYFW